MKKFSEGIFIAWLYTENRFLQNVARGVIDTRSELTFHAYRQR